MIVIDGPWQEWPRASGPSSVTIGVLDGVHVGHRDLLSRLDRSMTRTVLTFDPHPVEVLRPGTPPRLITTIDEREALLDDAGVDRVGVLDLNHIKEQSPTRFVEDVLVDKLRIGQLVVGGDFRFGKDRSGDVELLTRLGPGSGFGVDVIELVTDGETPVSSSRIRELIESGAVSPAADLLGSWFTVTNTVIHGDERGHDLGFPTANIRPPDRKVIPGKGVYSCFATIDGRRHDAAVNVGVRPTFGGGELLIEAHILDFADEIYGNEMTLEFVEYTRPELEFESVDELITRMYEDVMESRGVLGEARSRI